MFARMEEDVSAEGLALETRIYEESGKQTVKVKVKKHHKVRGVMVVDLTEAIAQTPSGEVWSTTITRDVAIDLREGDDEVTR
jgi:hypothetical protein